MHRYYAYLACESRCPGEAIQLLLASFRLAPIRFLMEPRAWTMLAAIVMRCVLGERTYSWLERFAFGMRSHCLEFVTVRLTRAQKDHADVEPPAV